MNKEKGKKIFSIGLLLIGITAIIFAIVCLTAEPCIWDTTYVYKETYGGDAYTGIQNAAAITANNIQYLDLNLQYATEFFANCMGYVLLIVGLLLLLFGTTQAINAFSKKITVAENVQTPLENNQAV